MNLLLESVSSHSSVSFHVLPLAKQPESKRRTEAPRKIERALSRDPSGSPPRPLRQRVRKGKGKGKSNRKGPRVPERFIGKALETPDGPRSCWAFNLNGCADVQPGQACKRGFNLCAEPGCSSLMGFKPTSDKPTAQNKASNRFRAPSCKTRLPISLCRNFFV